MIGELANRLVAAGHLARGVFLIGWMGIAVIVPLFWLAPIHTGVALGAQTRVSHTATYGLAPWLSLDQKWREPPGQRLDPADPAWPFRHSMSTLQYNIRPRGVFVNTLLTVFFVIPLFVWRLFARGDPSARPCGVCGYDMRAIESTQCPECGTPLKQQTPRHLIWNMNAQGGDILRLTLAWAIVGAFTWIVGGALALIDMYQFAEASRTGTVTFQTSGWGTRIFLGMTMIWLTLAVGLAAVKLKNSSQVFDR